MNREDVNLEENSRRLVYDSNSVEFPYAIQEFVVVGDLIVACCASFTTEEANVPEIQLPSDERNVVAITEQGEVQWFVAPPPDNHTDDLQIYKSIDVVTDRLLAAHENGHRYQIDVSSGDIVSSWDDSQLPIGDTIVDVPDTITEILEIDSKLFVRVGNLSWEVGNIFAFAEDGTQLWRSEKNVGSIRVEDGELWGSDTLGPRQWQEYPIDTETGEIGEKEQHSPYEE